MPLTAASPPSHLLSDVPILLSHGGTTGCKWPKSPRVGGPSVTCRVTQQPTDATMEEQRKQKGSSSTGNMMTCLFYSFSGVSPVRCLLPYSPNKLVKMDPHKLVKMGTAVSLGRPGQGWSGKGGASGCDGPSVRARALSGPLLPTEDAPLCGR